MSLKKHCERVGNWFFRYRGILPFLLLPLYIVTFLWSADAKNAFIHTSLWELFCFAISLCGACIRIWTIGQVPPGTSGRNTAEQVAEVLNTKGPYSIMRHPLYVGNFLIFAGLALWPAIWWFALLSFALFALYYERIMFAEEAFLQRKFGDLFLEWADRTPAFFPRIASFTKSEMPFSWRKVLRQEYTTWLMLPVSYALLEILYVATTSGEQLHPIWLYLTTGFFILALLLRFLKYRTQLLR